MVVFGAYWYEYVFVTALFMSAGVIFWLILHWLNDLF